MLFLKSKKSFSFASLTWKKSQTPEGQTSERHPTIATFSAPSRFLLIYTLMTGETIRKPLLIKAHIYKHITQKKGWSFGKTWAWEVLRTGLVPETAPSEVLGWQPQISYVFCAEVEPCQEDGLINNGESPPLSDTDLRVSLTSIHVSLSQAGSYNHTGHLGLPE